MPAKPPQLNTNPGPDWERGRYSPAQNPFPCTATAKPSVEFGKPTRMDRFRFPDGPAPATADDTFCAVFGFFILLIGVLQLLLERWLRGSLALLFVAALMLAPYYAKRPRIRHRLARFLRKTFYLSLIPPGSATPSSLFLRQLVVAVLLALSIFLLFWPKGGALPFFMKHPAPIPAPLEQPLELP